MLEKDCFTGLVSPVMELSRFRILVGYVNKEGDFWTSARLSGVVLTK